MSVERKEISSLNLESWFKQQRPIQYVEFKGEYFLSYPFRVSLIESSKFDKLTIWNTFCESSLHLKDCEIQELELIGFAAADLTITGGKYKKITISTGEAGASKYLSVSLNDLDCPDMILEIQNVLVSTTFTCTNVSLKQITLADVQTTILSFTNVNFETELLLNTVKASSVDCKKVNSESGKLWIKSLNKSSLKFDACNIGNIILLTSELSVLHLTSCLTDLMEIQRCTADLLAIDGGNYLNVQLKRLMFNHLRVDGHATEPVTVYNFFLDASVATANDLIFRNVLSEKFEIQEYRSGNFYMDNCNVTRIFRIEKSSLSKSAAFRHLDLQDCKSVSFFDTNLIGPEFFNVRWHSSYVLDEHDELTKGATRISKINHYWKVRESYRQLKVVSTTNHNAIDSHNFQRGELAIYYKILRLKRGKVNYWNDYLILLFSGTFGGYGQSLWRPVGWWIFFHTILFFMILHYGKFPFTPAWDLHIDWQETKRAFGLYLNLLSPVHSSEYFGIRITGITDFFLRLVSGFFIYYIIRASRKFV